MLLIIDFKWADITDQDKLTRHETVQLYSMVYFSSVVYPFGGTTFTKKQCSKLQATALKLYLPHVSLNRRYLQEVLFGLARYRDHRELSFHTMQGYKQLQLLVGLLRNQDKTGKLIQQKLEYFQLVAGVSTPIMSNETPATFTKWTEGTWLVVIKKFLMSPASGNDKL